MTKIVRINPFTTDRLSICYYDYINIIRINRKCVCLCPVSRSLSSLAPSAPSPSQSPFLLVTPSPCSHHLCPSREEIHPQQRQPVRSLCLSHRPLCILDCLSASWSGRPCRLDQVLQQEGEQGNMSAGSLFYRYFRFLRPLHGSNNLLLCWT